MSDKVSKSDLSSIYETSMSPKSPIFRIRLTRLKLVLLKSINQFKDETGLSKSDFRNKSVW